MGLAGKYESLPEEDRDQELSDGLQAKLMNKSNSSPTSRAMLYLLVVTLTLAIFAATSNLAIKKTAAKMSWKHCGNSTSEAKENGCRFDIMMHSWVPQECYNEQLSEEYIEANDFRFFSDAEATVEVPLDVVRLGELKELYTGLSHHVIHCTYIWRLLVLAATEGRPWDSLSSSEDHTGHCGSILLHGLPWTEPSIGNESTLSPDFLSCGYY